MEGDIEYKQIGLNMADMQMLETREFSIPEICRWFLVSPHLVGDLSRATFSNIEQLALEFVKMTLSAWITRWEQELYRCVLTPEEKAAGYYFRHNLSGLLRGDFQTRMAGYATMLQNGIANVDEVRDLEDWNPLPDGAGEDYHIQLNMQALPATGVPQNAQSAALIRLGKQRRAA
jgi:HK97 family phage portal protein